MKKIFLLSCFMSCSLATAELIPEKLEKATDLFYKNPELFPIYRIDFVIFSNENVEITDKVEKFPELERFNHSEDLLRLSKTPTLLVKHESIEDALLFSNEVIKSIKISGQEIISENSKSKGEKKLNLEPSYLPYEYYELLDEIDAPINKLVKKLKIRKEYNVLFAGSWYQPIFNQEFANPVYISNTNQMRGTYGELLVYKEKFLHSTIKLRLTEKSDISLKQDLQLILYDFNELLEFSKVNKNLPSFLVDRGKKFNSISNILFGSKNLSLTTDYKETIKKELPSYYIDRYELDETIKMKENEFYYIDHPYFGVILKISLWEEL